MPDLEMLLRDVRPAPDPAWAARARRPRGRRLPRPAAALEAALHRAARRTSCAFGAVAAVASC